MYNGSYRGPESEQHRVWLIMGAVDALLKEGEQKWKGFESVERAGCCGLVFLR